MVSRAGDDAVVRHILRIPQVTKVEIKKPWKNWILGQTAYRHTLNFGDAVNRYTNDDASRFTGGMIQGPNGGCLTIDQLDKDMVTMLKDLRVGQYSAGWIYRWKR